MGNRTRFASALHRRTGVAFTEKNAVEVVPNGRVFDAMEEAIVRARETVHLVMYIWRDGVASDRVVDALVSRAREGVRCRVLVDPVGTRIGFGRVRDRLTEAGCEVRLFVRDAGLEPSEVPARSHRKLLVVDGRVGLTGGWCIWDEFLGDGLARHAWRDTNARVRGPVVAQMQHRFVEQWRSTGASIHARDTHASTAPAGDVRACFVDSPGGGEPTGAEALTQLVVESAERRLWLSIAYFVPEDGWVEELARRAREGLDVRVLVPGPVHDLALIRMAQRSTYGALLRSGVRIWEYQPSMMHSKCMVADDSIGVVGSINLEPFSQEVVEEASLVVDDVGVAEELARLFVADLSRSREVRRARGGVLAMLGRAILLFLGAFAGLVRLRRRGLLRRPRTRHPVHALDRPTG